MTSLKLHAALLVLGNNNPNKAANVAGFSLSPDEKKDLIAFLNSLTDAQFLTDPRHADPWTTH